LPEQKQNLMHGFMRMKSGKNNNNNNNYKKKEIETILLLKAVD
jgi:hypothetical protein